MSELYEGVVFRSDERTARRSFASLSSALRLRLVRLGRGVFGIYRVAGRTDAFDPPAVERVAALVSSTAGRAVALFYDNGCGVRIGVLYSGGRRNREFGEDDAWWVPYGHDGPRHRVTELRRGEDYDCVYSAIDAALEAIGVGPRMSESLVKQAFSYDEIEPLAESWGLSRP